MKRTIAAFALVAAGVSLVATASCGPNEECLRVSDCDEGFTCTAGRCRSVDELSGAGLDVASGEGGAGDAKASDAKTNDATTARDATSEAAARDGGADATSSDAPAG